MRLRIALASCAAAVLMVAPAAATQDVGSESLPIGEAEVAPMPLIVPNITETRRLAPALPRNTGVGRRVVYSNSLQWVWVIDRDEQVIRSMPVSGKRGVPTRGTYRVTSQSRWSFSPEFEGVTFRWMTRFAIGPQGGNIGFHEIPRKNGKVMQTYAQLGSFAGSGCVRMATEDVKFIYEWAKPGTQVIVTR